MEIKVKIGETEGTIPADADIMKMTVKNVASTSAGSGQLWICKELKWIGVNAGDKVIVYKDKGDNRLIIRKL